MVAQALVGRRLVMDRLRAVNAAAIDALDGPPALAGYEQAGIVQRATSASVQLAALQRAWDDVSAALDGIDSRKESALAALREAARELDARRAVTSGSGGQAPPADGGEASPPGGSPADGPR
jgi:uncharacterized protein YaaN involved in tellurite resistance